jgi:hypothetical protein
MNILLAGVLVVQLLGLASAERPASSAYFPLEKGFSWVYDTLHKPKKDRFYMKVVVEGPWKEKNLAGIVLTQQDKRGKMREFLFETEEGVFLYKLGLKKSISPEVETKFIPADSKFTPAVPRVIYPLKPGTKVHWEGRLKVAWVNKKIIFDGEVLGFEEIEVPAGKFRCIKLHFHEKRDDEVIDQYYWYAEGVGQVKSESGEYVKELKSFKAPAKMTPPQ